MTARPFIDLRELQRNWDAFGRIDPRWAILTDLWLRGNKWDPAEFFSTGRVDVAALTVCVTIGRFTVCGG